MWTRNNDVPDRNMLKHFIYSSSSKPATSLLCSFYYRYSSELSSFFCILSFLVIATSIDQTFYSATHYLAAVWLDSRHDSNTSHLSCYSRKKNDQHVFSWLLLSVMLIHEWLNCMFSVQLLLSLTSLLNWKNSLNLQSLKTAKSSRIARMCNCI